MKVHEKDGVRRSTRRVVRAFSQHKARFVRMAEIHTDGEAIYSYGVTIAVRRGRRIYVTDGPTFGVRIRRRCSEVMQLLPSAKIERDLLGAAKAAEKPVALQTERNLFDSSIEMAVSQ